MAQQIGSAKAVQGHMTAMGSEGARSLQAGSPLYTGDIVSTAKGSAGSIQFLDHTVLNVGEGSKVILDKYVYDSAKGSGQALLKLAQGTFRTVTGEIVKHSPESFKVQSPLATIGIRGTETAHTVPPPEAEGASESHLVMVFDGKPVIVQPLGGGQFQVLSQSGVKVDVGSFGAGPVLVMTPQEYKYFQALTANGLQQGVPTDTVSPGAQSQGQGQGGGDGGGKAQAARIAAARAEAVAEAKATALANAKAVAEAAAKAAAEAAAKGDMAAKAEADAAAKAALAIAMRVEAEAKAAASAAAKAEAEAFAAHQAQVLADSLITRAAGDLAAKTVQGILTPSSLATLFGGSGSVLGGFYSGTVVHLDLSQSVLDTFT
jgi:hypothetical protein